MVKKTWKTLLPLVPVRATEMLSEAQQAVTDGRTLSAHRWAFVQAMEWRDDSGLNRNSLQYRFANAIVQWMCANWAKELN